MKITTFEDAKAGDQLWSVEFGWGEVVSRDNVSKSFTVEFNGDEFETYCFKGSRKRPLREKCKRYYGMKLPSWLLKSRFLICQLIPRFWFGGMAPEINFHDILVILKITTSTFSMEG